VRLRARGWARPGVGWVEDQEANNKVMKNASIHNLLGKIAEKSSLELSTRRWDNERWLQRLN
jgi:hypothetical protein